MDNKYLLNNEQVITQSNGNVITLTNLRLRHFGYQWGKAHIVSLLLEKISSIEIHYRSNPIFLFLAIIAIAGELLAGVNGGEFVGMGIVAGVVLIIFYLFSRKHYLTISSDGGGKFVFVQKE